MHTLKARFESARSVAWSPDGYLLASGSRGSTVSLWDVPTGAITRVMHDEHGWEVHSVAWSRCGGLVLQELGGCGAHTQGQLGAVWVAPKLPLPGAGEGGAPKAAAAFGCRCREWFCWVVDLLHEHDATHTMQHKRSQNLGTALEWKHACILATAEDEQHWDLSSGGKNRVLTCIVGQMGGYPDLEEPSTSRHRGSQHLPLKEGASR
jgi:hypothetical protein